MNINIRKKLHARHLALQDLLAREKAETERVRKLRAEWDRKYERKIKTTTDDKT